MSDFINKLNEIDNSIKATDAHNRLAMLFDNQLYTELDRYTKAEDFGGVVTAVGLVEGNTVYAFAQNNQDNLGAMSGLQWQKVNKLYELAAKTGAPIVGIYDSKGASLKNPLDTMNGYKEFVKNAGMLSGVVPQISVIVGNCGGTSAVIATMADIVIMSEKASLYITPPFNAGISSGTAEFCAKNGTAHIICEDDAQCVNKARELLTILPANNLTPPPLFNYSEAGTAELTAQCGKDNKAFAIAVADEYSTVEFSKDFGTGAYTAIGTIGGSVAGIVATTSDYISANDADKLARFANFCDCFNIPLVTVIDSKGFEKDGDAEKNGSIKSASKLTAIYAGATTAKIALIAGNAIAGAYMALTNADITIATPNGVISPLEVETAVAFLYEDKISLEFTREMAETEYKNTEASVFEVAKQGYIDFIIAPENTRATVIQAISMLRGKKALTQPKKHINAPM